MTHPLQATIEELWERRTELSPQSAPTTIAAIESVIGDLDAGKLRVAEKIAGEWFTHQWIKKAVLLSFRVRDNRVQDGGDVRFYDKVDTKFQGWTEEQFRQGGFRVVPGTIVRKGSYVAKNAVLMPSFVNIGAYVDEATMVDTWVTVGSCAQIGKNVHLSGGVGIGGVLEPLQANPTIIEDNCFIGARSEVAEGVIVREGSVLSMGTFITSTTRIVDRKTGEVFQGEVPPYSVIMPGSMPSPFGEGLPSINCAVIVKTVDERTRSKTSINELLRD